MKTKMSSDLKTKEEEIEKSDIQDNNNDNNKLDLNMLDRAKYKSTLKTLLDEDDDDSKHAEDLYSSILEPNNDCTYFPLYIINKEKVNSKIQTSNELIKNSILKSNTTNECFDSFGSDWNSNYTQNFDNIKCKTNDSTVFDPYLIDSKSDFILQEEDNHNPSTKSSLFNKILSIFNKTPVQNEANNNDNIINTATTGTSLLTRISNLFAHQQEANSESNSNQVVQEDSIDLVDINLIDKGVYEIVPKKNQDDFKYFEMLRPTQDVTYFPLNSLNCEIFSYVKRLDSSNSKKLASKTSACPPEIFDSFDQDLDNLYLNKNKKILKSNDPATFDPYNAAFEPFQTIMEKNEEILNEPFKRRRAIFDFIAELTRTIFHFENSEKKDEAITSSENFNADLFEHNDDKVNYFKLEEFIEDFKIKEFSEINNLYQQSFYRAPLQCDNEHGLLFNSIINTSSPKYDDTYSKNRRQFVYFDLLSIQNLSKTKPYFDDFAVFPDQRYEYTQYDLISSYAEKFIFTNSIKKRSNGKKPYFFIQSCQNLLENVENSKLDLKNIIGYGLISIGALSLFSFTFVKP